MNSDELFENKGLKKALSKMMSYILRHNPEKFDIILDNNGFTDLRDLLNVLKNRKPWVTLAHIEDIVATSEKKRFEISGDKIRARYGHSVEVKPVAEDTLPPEILFHGTTPKFLEDIREKGLKSMGRVFVHLSEDKKTALMVGRRRHKAPVILEITAKKAAVAGIKFRKEGDTWLSDPIPPEFIVFPA